jgi:hypothetical protein
LIIKNIKKKLKILKVAVASHPQMAKGVAGPPHLASFKEKLAKWLDSFKEKTMIFCAFGKECILKKDQFQELVMGFELS